METLSAPAFQREKAQSAPLFMAVRFTVDIIHDLLS
jgi:hypothetical protein